MGRVTDSAVHPIILKHCNTSSKADSSHLHKASKKEQRCWKTDYISLEYSENNWLLVQCPCCVQDHTDFLARTDLRDPFFGNSTLCST